MSSKLVERRLNDFKRRCGKDGDAALQLAYHAAMPVALNPELLHFLRINFFLDPPEQLPYTVEFEFLSSGLCREIDAELYEIEPEIRSELLQELMSRKDASQRIRDIATLLWQYVEYHSPWADRVELERAQQLTALNFLDPAKAKQWLDEAEGNSSLGRGEREWFITMRQEIEQILQHKHHTLYYELRELLRLLIEKKQALEYGLLTETNASTKSELQKQIEEVEVEVHKVVQELQKIEGAKLWLTGSQIKQLRKAFLSAFPTSSNLAQMLSFRLDENLDVIATGANLSEIVFQLIKWAEAEERLEELLTAAIKGNPQNPQLRSFYEQILGIPIEEEQSKQDYLDSDKGVDYTRLRDLLAAGKWKEADEETLAVMLKAAEQEKNGWLNVESIKNFPCTDLLTIDQLWVKYSNRRFGFSVQKRIWESVGGKPNADYETFGKFCDCVGWLVKNELLDHKDLQFNLNAPLGHLPSHLDLIGFDSLGGSLFSRVQTCEVEATKVSENG